MGEFSPPLHFIMRVGKKKFPSTRAGMSKAKEYSKQTGVGITVGGKQKDVGSSSVKKPMKTKARKSTRTRKKRRY